MNWTGNLYPFSFSFSFLKNSFSSTEGVIFIGATNTEESLDKALVRPGRLDRRINVPLPDVGGRHKILDVHARTVSIDSDVDMKIIARGTPGKSI